MMNSSVEIGLLESHSNCEYHQTKGNCTCFRGISINRNTYTTDDYIFIRRKQDLEIVKLSCIFLKDDKNYAVLRKFIFAKNVKTLFQKHGFDFDWNNEVVEDPTVDNCIELEEITNGIIQKCSILYMTEHEDSSSFISDNNLDRNNIFVCRFSMKSQCLIPIFTAEKNILTENWYNSPKCSKSKVKMGVEITPSTYVIVAKENNIIPDMFSPPQRNSVKRNLNISFGNSPQDHNKSILNYSVANYSDSEMEDATLNYSIVNNNDDESNNPLILKLRISENINTPIKNNIDIPSHVTSAARKSTRNIERKSYADYLSPHKSTPTKRTRKVSIDDDFIPETRKIARETPKKTPSRRIPNQVLRSSKRNVTPKRFITEIGSCEDTTRVTPARRHLKLSQAEDTETPRSLRSCQKSKVFYKEDNMGIHELSDVDSGNRILKIDLPRLPQETERFFRDKPSNCEVEIVESNDEECIMQKDRAKTPRSTRKPTRMISSDSESDIPPSTPKTRRGASAKSNPKPTPKSRSTIKQTPKHTPHYRAKLIREGVVTPSMHARSNKVTGVSTPLMIARSQLHVSYVPDSLPCREKEYCDVFSFVEGKLLDGYGGCMYISGVPGTGKTATVTSVINNLSKSDAVPEFTFVNVNGMRLTEPRQAYVEIFKQLQGKTVPWEQAQSMLNDLFSKPKKLKPVVMLIDELDMLCTRRQDVVYNLLDWPTKVRGQLIVITIANTMDLPERLLMSRVASRLGLTRLSFHAYTHKQLQEIVARRLCGTDCFKSDAVQFVARKVASVSGDARRALDICRKAAEIAESEGKGQLVGMDHVNEALNAMITQPKIRAIRRCSRLQQLIMQATVAEVERTGVEETTFADVFKMFETCATLEAFQMVSTTVALSAIAKLGACRLILTDQKGNDIYQRIRLNVSVDDVYYALKKN